MTVRGAEKDLTMSVPEELRRTLVDLHPRVMLEQARECERERDRGVWVMVTWKVSDGYGFVFLESELDRVGHEEDAGLEDLLVSAVNVEMVPMFGGNISIVIRMLPIPEV